MDRERNRRKHLETRHGISLSFHDPDSIVGHAGICHQEYAGFPLSDFHVDKQIVADISSGLSIVKHC